MMQFSSFAKKSDSSTASGTSTETWQANQHTPGTSSAVSYDYNASASPNLNFVNERLEAHPAPPRNSCTTSSSVTPIPSPALSAVNHSLCASMEYNNFVLLNDLNDSVTASASSIASIMVRGQILSRPIGKQEISLLTFLPSLLWRSQLLP